VTREDASKLDHGLYILHWKDPSSRRTARSLASVGMTFDGTRQFAPCNWTSADNARPMVASTDWSNVDRVTRVAGYELLEGNDDDWRGP
jgi:hypothetical protein